MVKCNAFFSTISLLRPVILSFSGAGEAFQRNFPQMVHLHVSPISQGFIFRKFEMHLHRKVKNSYLWREK